MNSSIRCSQNVITFGLPLLIVLSVVFLSQSPWFYDHPRLLSVGIILDLTLTVPLLYLFLIRKKEIPKTTAVPFFIVGIFVASYVVPADHQSLLAQIKLYGIPVVEVGVLLLVIMKVRKVRRSYRYQQEGSFDFFTVLNSACREVLPKRAAAFVATEIGVFNYGFVDWKKRELGQHEFSCHKNSGTVAVLAVLIMIIFIESLALHFLLQRWSTLAAWILTALSLYSVVQVFGMLRSLSKRPISIENGVLELRYGIMGEASIPLGNIEAVELSTMAVESNKEIRKLSPLGDLESHNVLIHVKEENQMKGLYGKEKTFKTIAFFVDEKERFEQEVNVFLGRVSSES